MRLYFFLRRYRRLIIAMNAMNVGAMIAVFAMIMIDLLLIISSIPLSNFNLNAVTFFVVGLCVFTSVFNLSLSRLQSRIRITLSSLRVQPRDEQTKNEQTKKIICECLRLMNLKQEPPRKRSILVNQTASGYSENGQIQQVNLGWVTIGYLPSGTNYFGALFAFCHERPWNNIEDAVDILSPIQNGHLHQSGICLPTKVHLALESGTMTPSEAFWGTCFAECPEPTHFRFNWAILANVI
jgi:hypothetical protein